LLSLLIVIYFFIVITILIIAAIAGCHVASHCHWLPILLLSHTPGHCIGHCHMLISHCCRHYAGLRLAAITLLRYAFTYITLYYGWWPRHITPIVAITLAYYFRCWCCHAITPVDYATLQMVAMLSLFRWYWYCWLLPPHYYYFSFGCLFTLILPMMMLSLRHATQSAGYAIGWSYHYVIGSYCHTYYATLAIDELRWRLLVIAISCYAVGH